jgi:hypothetical protein
MQPHRFGDVGLPAQQRKQTVLWQWLVVQKTLHDSAARSR